MNPQCILTLAAVCLSSTVSIVSADDYVVTGRDSRLYEQPDIKGAVTRNMNDENISVSKGMVFKVVSKDQGWVRVNYTPGVSAFVLSPSLTETTLLRAPLPGEYTVSNNSSLRVVIKKGESDWTLHDGSSEFKGTQFDKVIVFFDTNGEQRFSMANIEGTMTVMDYNNEITQFF